MADIFISYAQADREWVGKLAGALEALGFSTWWDPDILPGTRYRDVIERELKSARAVIVVWSAQSIDSDWVRDEAEDARRAEKLIPVLKERIRPPHGFRQLQTADLSDWKQQSGGREFSRVAGAVAAFMAKERTGAPKQYAAVPHAIPIPAPRVVSTAEKLLQQDIQERSAVPRHVWLAMRALCAITAAALTAIIVLSLAPFNSEYRIDALSIGSDALEIAAFAALAVSAPPRRPTFARILFAVLALGETLPIVQSLFNGIDGMASAPLLYARIACDAALCGALALKFTRTTAIRLRILLLSVLAISVLTGLDNLLNRAPNTIGLWLCVALVVHLISYDALKGLAIWSAPALAPAASDRPVPARASS